MITLRHAKERGFSQTGWLKSRHTFSFAEFHDPAHMGFRALRVINDDRVGPSSGFGAHQHRDMEIISYVISGTLGHEDSMGTGSTIVRGDVQRMSAGSGVVHSEWNHSKDEPVHFLQIWITPAQKGIAPSYEQRTFEPSDLQDRLRLVVSPDGREGSLTVHQDAALYVTRLSVDKSVRHELAKDRHVWVQVASGSVLLNDVALGEGDGAAVSDETQLDLRATSDAEVLLFELA